MEDNMEFVVGSTKEVRETEMKEEGIISKVTEVKSNTEDEEYMAVVKSQEDEVLNKDENNQGDLVEKRGQQRKPVTQNTSSGQEDYLSPEVISKDSQTLDIEKNIHVLSNILQQKDSALSLRSITTNVLRVLNAAEDVIHGSMGDKQSHPNRSDLTSIPPTEAKRLDEQLSRLEENVYVAAGAAFGLEAELRDLEKSARSISGSTSEEDLAHLEDQVASAAARVKQSELQVLGIAARITALKKSGLNVAPQTHLSCIKSTNAQIQTISSCRKLRRRLPAPPTQDKEV